MRLVSMNDLQTELILCENWFEIANEFTADKNLDFQISPEIIAENGKWIVKGYLSNPSADTREIVVMKIGKMGFSFDFAETESFRYIGQKFPPEPPPPLRITVPPETKVEFSDVILEKPKQVPGMPIPDNTHRSNIYLSDYEYSGTPTVDLEWGFYYWNNSKPKGTLPLALPPR